MMKILFDISHPAHINFLKKAIEIINETTEHKVYVTYLNRGIVPKLIISEFHNFETTKIGNHKGTRLSVIIHANIFRFFKMLVFILKNRIEIGVNGGPIVGAALRLLGRKYIQFDDDYERRFVVNLERLLSNKLYFPSYISERKNIFVFNALKEWAYLSPKYFNPDRTVLSSYGLLPKKYIFIREVSTSSFNYSGQSSGIIADIANKIPANIKVVLSLEEKKNRTKYPPGWLMLDEPVRGIHSIIYFSRLLISSGDSMAREGGMLGIPSIYCGIRDMLANKMLINKGILFWIKPEKVPVFVDDIIQNRIKLQSQEDFRSALNFEWDDVTEFIVKNVTNI